MTRTAARIAAITIAVERVTRTSSMTTRVQLDSPRLHSSRAVQYLSEVRLCSDPFVTSSCVRTSGPPQESGIPNVAAP